MESPLIHTLRQAAALKRKWERAEEPSFLGWITMLDPAVAEIEVDWGYDGLIIDTEHSTFDVTALRTTLMAFRGTDCVPIVRVGANDIYLLKRALDAGAGGVLIPLIQDADDARAAVDNCRYTPQGSRGVAPLRASNYMRDVEAYLDEANRSVIVIAQIECVAAYENLDAILEVDGIDCFLVGQVDLSASMGHMWDPGHPKVAKTVEDIIRRCRQANRPVAVAAGTNIDELKHWLDVGANVLSSGGDLGFMLGGFYAFKARLEQAGLHLG